MKMFTYSLLLILLSFGLSQAQDVPAGVRYKKASDKMNGKAKALLEKALSNPAAEIDIDTTFGKTAIMCGPFVWELVGDGNSFKDSSTVKLIVNGVLKEGRGITDSEQKRLIWKRLLEKMGNTIKPIVRKANADEIGFYWAMIPFDIEEPLFIVDYGKEKLLVNFIVKSDQPHFFWIDLVKDIRPSK